MNRAAVVLCALWLAGCGTNPLTPSPAVVTAPAVPVYAGPTLYATPNTASDAKPTVLVFAVDGETTQRDYFTFVDPLIAEGWLAVTFDLPYHTVGDPNLAAWKDALLRGEDLIGQWTHTVSLVLDHLIASGRSSRFVAVGISRGGFMALHAAAGDPRIRAVAGLAPVTELGALAEFAGAESDPRVVATNLRTKSASLRMPVWLTIGRTDTRVSTAACQTFVDTLRAGGGDVTFTLNASTGHATPAGDVQAASAWLARF
jgi:dienelactone hydrolase